MAVIGDVLVKLALNAAEFVSGLDQANAKLDEQGKRLADHGSKLEGIAKQLAGLGTSTSIDQFVSKLEGLATSLGTVAKVGGAVALVVAAIGAAIKEGKAIEDYALAVSKLKDQYALTTVEAQAMENAMRATGRTADDLNKSLTAQQKQFLGDYFKAQFGDTTKQIEDVTAASEKLTDAWNDLKTQGQQTMLAVFGELTAAAINALTDAIKSWQAALRDAQQRAQALPQYIKEGRGNTDTSLILATPEDRAAYYAQQQAEQTQKTLEELAKKIEGYRTELADAQKQSDQGLDRGGMIAADIDNFKKKIADLTNEMLKLSGAGAQVQATLAGAFAGTVSKTGGLLQTPVPSFAGAGPNVIAPNLANLPSYSEIQRMMSRASPTPTTAGGGGGRTDDDYLDAQTRRYEALQKAAEKAYASINSYTGTNIEDLQKQVNTQRQIDDILGKINAKWLDAHPAARAALETAVTGAENARLAQEKLIESMQKAIDTERKYGDGTAAQAKVERDLNQQKATGKLSTEAYTRALKEQTEQVQQAALASRRYEDNLGSLAAGFEHAANAYARANDLYSVGEQTFNGLTSAMGEGLDVLMGKSTKTFGQIATDFAAMLAKMALQAATSAVFKTIFGSITGSGGWGLSGGGAAVTPFEQGTQALFGGFRAAGGPVDVGRSYVVGENGPERFVPSVAGTIQPNGSSGGGTINVNVDMGRQQGAQNPSAALEFGRRVRAAVVEVIANEKRPGGTLYARHNA